MNNARNTIPKKSLTYYINQTERALSALLPPLRRQILAVLQQHREGQSAYELANNCQTSAARITAHIDKLVKYQYVYTERVANETYYYLSNKRIKQVKGAVKEFLND